MPDLSTNRPIRRSIFIQGPDFTLDTFSSREFIVKDFIESLSDSATPFSTRRRSAGGPPATTAASSSQPFDPRPLIRTFEDAQRRLVELSGDLEIRENELSAAVRRAEAQHAANVSSLGDKLNLAIESFEELDNIFNLTGGGGGGGIGFGINSGG